MDGLEINLKKLDSKSDISDFITTVKQKFAKDLLIFLSVPAKTEVLAKYYDFKALSKHTDHFIVQTAFLGASKNVTFHPSPLSGLWDVQNTVNSVLARLKVVSSRLNKICNKSKRQLYKSNENVKEPQTNIVSRFVILSQQ